MSHEVSVEALYLAYIAFTLLRTLLERGEDLLTLRITPDTRHVAGLGAELGMHLKRVQHLARKLTRTEGVTYNED